MPRTQTSEQAPPVLGFPVVFWSLRGLTAGQQLFFNDSQFQMYVLTNIDVVSRDANNGDSILIGGLTNSAGLFGALTGAGLYDTFSWRGNLALPFGATLEVIAISGGGWDSIGGGYVIANPFSIFA